MQHFDLCVIGSGSGNSLVDERFADWDVAMVDDSPWFGGTCLNVGCIPTKMFVLPADLARTPDHAERLNVSLDPAEVDWPAMRDRIFGRIDPIADAGERWRDQASNVTLFRETAAFVGDRTLRVGAETITADRVVVAAGSRPTLGSFDGLGPALASGRVHTSDSVMRLDTLPRTLAIVGSGFVAAEFAHVFAAFGTRVTVLARGDLVLRREDAEISRRFTDALAGYTDLRTRFHTTGLEVLADGVRVHGRGQDLSPVHVDAEAVLLAVGRTPNSDRLGVEAGGLATDAAGFVVVDHAQRTTAEGVWALGDISSPWMLKHVANHEARVVQHNLLHPEAPITTDHTAVPHAVFGHPQVAAVGLTETEAREAGLDVAVAVQEYGSVAYGWALEDTFHCAKIVAERGTGRIVGAHLIGPQAPTLIQPLIQAMATGLDAYTMARGQYWIHPALTEVVENALLALDTPRPA